MIIDCVMLSYSKSPELKAMTQNAINTLHASSKEHSFRVWLVETENQYEITYDGATVIQPKDKFGYNKFLNIGMRKCISEYIVLANNDLEFIPGWIDEILRLRPYSASPVNPGWPLHKGLSGKMITGYGVSREICGWCLVVQKYVLNKLFPFDEQFDYWYQDNDYAMQLQKYNIPHVLVGNSFVKHLGSVSHCLINKKNLIQQTIGMAERFYKKYSLG
jgi:GT2 family glycosyltransferase